MEENTQAHAITLSFTQTPADEILAGSDVVLKVRAACSDGCDLRGCEGKIITQDDEVIKEFFFTQFFGVTETDDLILKAPLTAGQNTWTAVFPEQSKKDITHAEASTSCTFTVGDQHKTSIAVWDVASPITTGALFKAKVGVGCSANCRLSGKEVTVYDQEGTLASTGSLGETIWPGTTALYWTEVEVQAPDAEGTYTWTAHFSEQDTEIPHLESTASFSFNVMSPSDCVLTVTVTDQESGLLLNGAGVVVHPYRAKTGEDGTASLELVKGEYLMYVTKGKYDLFVAAVKVTGDLSLAVELTPAIEAQND